MRTPRSARLAGATTASSVATFTALFSHVIAGGAMPGWPGVLVPWGLSFVVCAVLSGRRLSLPRLAVAVASSQILFHTLFMIGAPPTRPSVIPSGHSHEVMAPAVPLDPAAAMTHADATMWIWHGIAALLTVAALYRGERALAHLQAVARGVGSWVRRILPSPVSAPTPLAQAATHAGCFDPIDHAPEPFLVSVGRRGPPQLQLL